MTMRRVFGCFAALFGALMVGAYAAADFLDRHADANALQETVRVATKTYDATADFMPGMMSPTMAYQAGEMAASQLHRVVGDAAASPEPCPEHAVCAPADPQPMAPVAQQGKHPDHVPGGICGALELIRVEPQPLPNVEEAQAEPPVCPAHHEVNGVEPPPVCEEKHEAGDLTPFPAVEPPAVSIPTVAVSPPHCDDATPCPSVMPHVEDTADVPAVMPRLEEECTEPAEKEAKGECKDECKCLFSFWMGLFKDAVGPDSGDTHEQSEKINEGMPPDCQEDPAIHHQYPGCPYGGCSGCPGCPGCPGRCPTPSKPEPKVDETQDAVPPNQAPEHKPAAVTPDAGTEDVPSHPEVDTTEFRPRQDAHKGEFDPRPFSIEE
jgi:hypothetical protein